MTSTNRKKIVINHSKQALASACQENDTADQADSEAFGALQDTAETDSALIIYLSEHSFVVISVSYCKVSCRTKKYDIWVKHVKTTY